MFRQKLDFTSFLVISLCSLLLLSAAAHANEHGHDRCRQHPFGQFSDWSEPVNLGPVVNSEFDDYHPAISNNGLSLYLTSNRPGGFSPDEDIWVSQRTSVDEPWGPPQHLGANINGPGGTCCPNLSPDEHWLYFSGNRPEGCDVVEGSYNLWVSHRADTNDDFGWEPPVNLGCQIYPDSRAAACAPTLFEDRQTGITTLYFCRSMGGLGDFDIYVSTLRRDGLFGRAALAWELDSPARDTRTAIRRDGLEMFITTNRPGGLGALDVWVATRETTLDAWSIPVNLGLPVNSPSADGGPSLSCDGTTMYFYSDRPGGFGGRDLYVTTRTELCDPNSPAATGHGREKK